MPARPIAILEAPSGLGLATRGVEGLAGRLLELGLADRIGGRNAGEVTPPAPSNDRSSVDGILNAEAIAAWSPVLADAVGDILAADAFPLVLGGDCTILLGPMLALRRRGRYGLLFIDGHADYFQPEAEPNGEGASMELAWVTGSGPPLLTDLEQRGPLVRSEDVVAFGYRDHDDQAKSGSQPLPSDLRAYDLPTLRKTDIATAAQEAVAHLTRAKLDGFFIHLDADVLDDAVMPAVDFRIPGGLSWDELRTVLGIALASPHAIGMEVTIYNPSLDAKGRAGRGLADLLAEILAPS